MELCIFKKKTPAMFQQRLGHVRPLGAEAEAQREVRAVRVTRPSEVALQLSQAASRERQSGTIPSPYYTGGKPFGKFSAFRLLHPWEFTQYTVHRIPTSPIRSAQWRKNSLL